MALCGGCGDRLADRLAAVGELAIELAYTRARWHVMTIAAGRGGEQGIPFTEVATQAVVNLTDTVLYWAQQVATARASVWAIPNTLAAVAHWLTMRLDWLRALDIAGEAYAQIDRAVSRARAVIDRPVHRTTFEVGPCPEIVETHYCAGMVWAYVPVRIGVDPAVLRCRNPDCYRHAQPWPTEQWREAGRRINRRREQQLSRRGLVTRSCGIHPRRGEAVTGIRADAPALGG